MPSIYRILLIMCMALVTPLSLVGCGDDDDTPTNGAGNGGDGDGDMGDGDGDGDMGDGDGDGDGDMGDGDGDGDGDMPDCDLYDEDKEEEDVPNPTGTTTLTSDKVWVLGDGPTYVDDGDVLTIEPCTRIVGGEDDSTLVVSRGGMIMAEGTADEPILFTSPFEPGNRRQQDWGGVILLGKASNFDGTEVQIEGLEVDDKNQHGGDEDDDDSGVMAYVRIEFGGSEISPGNEVNGLTFGSVGSGTEIHHVMVNSSYDDCFEWFGGTVDADHLICNNGGDDMFDADQGYIGTLEYLFGRDIETLSGDPNGFEMDSDEDSTSAPRTNVTANHVTLCGAGSDTSFGMVLRENLTGTFDDMAITGFEYGVDARANDSSDDFGDEDDANVMMTNVLMWGMDGLTADESGDGNNDLDFDEEMWFEDGDGNEYDPDDEPFSAEDCTDDDGPTSDVTDSDVGAFSGGADDWHLDGLWVSWEDDID